MPDVDIYDAIARFASQDRIGYVHFRNVVGRAPNYHEVFLDEGDVDMFKALTDLHRERLRRRVHPRPHAADDVRRALARRDGARARIHDRGDPRRRGLMTQPTSSAARPAETCPADRTSHGRR